MIGVVIVTFQSADVIEACLESLRISDYLGLRVVVCDNNSMDDTINVISSWAQRNEINIVHPNEAPETAPDIIARQLTLLQTGGNLGFAGGVNAGIKLLLDDPSIDIFWVLNPDCEVAPTAATAFAQRAAEAGSFSLMGGRVRFTEEPRRIQSDGGRIATWSGICSNLNYGLLAEDGITPAESDLDYISGANMLASREFIEKTGLLTESYFLYYEEVDWAARRGNLPLIWSRDAEVFHQGGTAIGSGTISRRPSAFANYFNYRNRIQFVKKFTPWALPTAWFLSMLRVLKLLIVGALPEAVAAAKGVNGLSPPQAVQDRIAPQDRKHAFPSKRST